MARKTVPPRKTEEAEYLFNMRKLMRRIRRILKRAAGYDELTEARINRIVIDLDDAVQKVVNTKAPAAAKRFVRKVNKSNRERNIELFKQATGISVRRIMERENITEQLRRALKENVALITGVSQQIKDRTERVMWRYYTVDPPESLHAAIAAVLRGANKNIRLIARDQTAKINGKLNELRQTNVGVKEYFWRDSRDERVRANHRSKRGKRFRWDKPPSDTGHPGEDYQCRCTAEAVIESIFEPQLAQAA